ncbi:predicted protein [Naegleria gruberi]|uniref:Predicted protein n=1 Tax=Naegleria gruberi TaxID=5762 RepID=D2W325_NAEGR|nr:uncharacterized protein NAEGRDRAFT_75795 [Naegleria gruberi]EFC36509.1 predicted protein [Naegleria gruberi]|eukprot:XP_002669253.1 predicted protein [Naegleria gruberi strain NEG-M]
MAEDLEKLPNGRITNDYLRKLCKSKGGYMTEHLNDKLYLQHKGVSKIENLEKFTGVKVLWLESNAIHEIQGLEENKEISCLYLHENCIEEIKGIFHCTKLHTLNLSSNFITHIPEELGLNCTNIQTLDLSTNALKTIDSVRGLRYLTSLNILDLSKNKLFEELTNGMDYEQTIEEFLTILKSIKDLRLLRLEGNEMLKKIPNYRKKIIGSLPSLTYLDSMPIFDDERRTVTAWMKGGLDAEREERKIMAQEKKDKERRNFEAFEQLIQQSKKEEKEKESKIEREQVEKKVEEQKEEEELEIIEDVPIRHMSCQIEELVLEDITNEEDTQETKQDLISSPQNLATQEVSKAQEIVVNMSEETVGDSLFDIE